MTVLCDSPEMVGLPFAAEDVEILDKVPPYTKARLVYKSPTEALHVFLKWKRSTKFSPSFLFTVLSGRDSPVPIALDLSFSTRQFQITQITRNGLCFDGAWPKSNVPKFRRLLPREGDDPTFLQQERSATRFLFLSNLVVDDEPLTPFWSDPQCASYAIRSTLTEFLGLNREHDIEVFCAHNKKLIKYCHVGLISPSDTQRALSLLQEKQVIWKWVDHSGVMHTQKSGPLFIDFAGITQRSYKNQDDRKSEPTRSECTSLTAHVSVPGLAVVPDFLTDLEEAALIALLTGPQAPWAPAQTVPSETGVVKRRVQHYGYVFDYHSADVLRDRTKTGADCPPMPAINLDGVSSNDDVYVDRLEKYIGECLADGDGWGALAGIVERTRKFRFEVDEYDGKGKYEKAIPTLNQLTLNEYAPGEGIGSHIDTPSAFGEGLISISMGSGIVMEFRKAEKDVPSEGLKKKLVYLPPRSVMLLSGDARYHWEHMIVSRMTDTYNGEVIRRGTRISLTLRTALDETGLPMPLIQSSKFPLVWGGEAIESQVSALQTPPCERDHVHAVYDAIATQWHHTRGRRGVLWPGATSFLQRLLPGSIVADIGCGDGKYFPAVWESGSYVIGTDISRPLLLQALNDREQDNCVDVPESRKVSANRRHLRDRPALAVADCMTLPIRTASCDAAICIAVLHHLSTENRRRRCIEELARIVRPGGLINVQAWAMEQEAGSRRKFAVNDIYVPFNAQPKHLKLTAHLCDTSMTLETGDDAVVPSNAEVYSKAHNVEYDDQKGLVVFKRYCHLYRRGELDTIAATVPRVEIVESGFESGNYFVILRVKERSEIRV